jgi:lysophospholipase L1-like esterase
MRRLIMPLRSFAFAALIALAACATTPAPVTVAAPQIEPTPVERITALGIDMPTYFGTWTAGHYPERVLLFEEYQPMNGGVAFVGDSITEGGDWNAFYPDLTVRNYGIGGDTTIGLERRISQIAAAKPATIFLLIGTNDLGNYNAAPSEIVANYASLLDAFAAHLPDTKVHMQAVLPREPRNAAAVIEINQGLEALAAERGLDYIDIYTPFAVEGGRLDPSVTNDDLHLTPAGYARWRAILDPLVRTP